MERARSWFAKTVPTIGLSFILSGDQGVEHPIPGWGTGRSWKGIGGSLHFQNAQSKWVFSKRDFIIVSYGVGQLVGTSSAGTAGRRKVAQGDPHKAESLPGRAEIPSRKDRGGGRETM